VDNPEPKRWIVSCRRDEIDFVRSISNIADEYAPSPRRKFSSCRSYWQSRWSLSKTVESHCKKAVSCPGTDAGIWRDAQVLVNAWVAASQEALMFLDPPALIVDKMQDMAASLTMSFCLSYSYSEPPKSTVTVRSQYANFGSFVMTSTLLASPVLSCV